MNKYVYISFNRGGYMVKVKTKYIGYKKTIEEAIKLRDEYCLANNIQLPKGRL